MQQKDQARSKKCPFDRILPCWILTWHSSRGVARLLCTISKSPPLTLHMVELLWMGKVWSRSTSCFMCGKQALEKDFPSLCTGEQTMSRVTLKSSHAVDDGFEYQWDLKAREWVSQRKKTCEEQTHSHCQIGSKKYIPILIIPEVCEWFFATAMLISTH